MELNSSSAEVFMYIARHAENLVHKMISMFKVVLVTGPRQVGKTTLLKQLLAKDYYYITLDDINELEVAKTDPKLFFLNNPGKIIIDEVQNATELFPEIKRIVDQSTTYGTIILTGSQSFSLMKNVSETLAGRVGILELSGLSLREIRGDSFSYPFIPDDHYLKADRIKTSNSELWRIIHRGAMPELYRDPRIDWQIYYASYVKTYIERDVRSLINVKDLALFSRFMVALAARTGQLVNYQVVASELGSTIKTIKSWMSVLEASGIIVLLPPFSNNRLTRTIKTPMLYFMDTGLVAYLLNWPSPQTLMKGAMSGAILETFVVSEIVKSFKNRGTLNLPLSFYRDRDMREIDLIVEDAGVLYPVEIKQSTRPSSRMGRHLNLLDRSEGYKTGLRLILAQVDKKQNLKQDLLAYPVTEL